LIVEALDGNSIAGSLHDHFGVEMTTARGTCAHCGAGAQIAELVVYCRAPGSVARCPSCGNIVMVLLTIEGILRVDLRAFRLRAAR
jgi:ribosomal protein S27AE